LTRWHRQRAQRRCPLVFAFPEEELAPKEARRRDKATLTVEALDRSDRTRLAGGKLLAIDITARSVFPGCAR